MIKSYYLDTNIISYLADPNHAYHRAVPWLRRCSKKGIVRVFSSANVIEELAGRLPKNVAEYKSTLALLFELSNGRIFRARRDLLFGEIRKRKRLSEREACLDSIQTGKLKSLAFDSEIAVQLGNEVLQKKNEFSDEWTGTFQTVETRIRGTPELNTARTTIRNEWNVDRERVFDFLYHILKTKMPESVPASFEEFRATWDVPCLMAFMAYILAKQRLNTIDGTKVRSGDGEDQSHLVYAAMPGTLVTDDAKFKRTCAEIKFKCVRVIDGREFCEEVMKLRRPSAGRAAARSSRRTAR